MSTLTALIPDGGTVNVAVQVVSSGKTGAITYQGGTVAGRTVTLEVAGNLGTQQLSFASGTTVSSIATAINGVKNATGLSAHPWTCSFFPFFIPHKRMQINMFKGDVFHHVNAHHHHAGHPEEKNIETGN